ncbi:MAG TPA: hypothetical protein VMK12_04480 [Anaeromyxobacteraceae bacterium]|nr:hypothetical protein [Anaeromyxobacteraceae bacterium]
MSKGRNRDWGNEGETPLELSHLRRETRTALELAVTALAPFDVIDRLAAAAGLFEAIRELPPNSPPVVALVPRLMKRANSAVQEWQRWYRVHLAKVKA